MSERARSMRPVVNWLLTGCAMIALMVLIGGITRLTESGLSITEWKPVSGALPPMSEAAWRMEFEKYQQIPEYRLLNSSMDLEGFKRIFFWEWLHRNWGRLMGLVFSVPFLVFWRQGRLKGWLMRRSIAILIGGGLVAALGWFMVVSGLSQNTDVSHFRLAIHLCAAFSLYALVFWTAQDITLGRRGFTPDGSGAGRWARWLLALLMLQIVYGAFTAGLDAGRIYNTWPLMNGEFMPENVTAFGSIWRNFADHRDGVQFVHRNLAWLVAAGFIAFAWRHRDVEDLPWRALIAAVLFQFVLGVLTLLTQVDILLGVLHQLGALLLLTVMLKAVRVTGRPFVPSAA